MTAKKKKMVKGLVVVALIAIIGIGATLAYLTSVTGGKTNTFTSTKNVKGTTEETFNENDAKNYEPGKEINKAPTVTLDANSEDAYVALSVDYIGLDGTSHMTQEQFKKYATINGLDLTKWTLIKTSAAGSELYMTNDPVEKGKSASPLFTSVTVNAKMKTVSSESYKTTTVYTYKDANNNGVWDTGEERTVVDTTNSTTQDSKTDYVDADGNSLEVASLPTFVIDIHGFAIQSANLDSTTAASELVKLANTQRTTDQF